MHRIPTAAALTAAVLTGLAVLGALPAAMASTTTHLMAAPADRQCMKPGCEREATHWCAILADPILMCGLHKIEAERRLVDVKRLDAGAR